MSLNVAHQSLLSRKPQLWLIVNDRSIEMKRTRYREEGQRLGFEVVEINEADIGWLEVHDGEFDIAFKSNSQLVRLAPPAVAVSICGTHFFAPMASELVRQLESMGVPISNSPEAKATADNKWWTHQRLVANKVSTPPTLYLEKDDHSLLKSAADELGYPLVLKTIYGEKGQGVWLCNSVEELLRHVEVLEPNREIILQKYIAASHGRDIRAIVVDGKVVASMVRRASKDGFHANLGAEGTGMAITLTAEQAALAVAATNALGLFFAGVDLLYLDDATLTVGEVNANPGLGIEEITEINVAGALVAALKTQL